MNQSEMIGSRLKEERLQQKLTLKQLSEKVGLSIGYLSQVERGYGTLSLSALKKLSSALGLEMSAFFDNHPEDDTASFSLPNTKMRGLIFELQPSFDPEEPLYSHPEEEILYVLEGSCLLTLEGKEYLLNPGDCVHIPANAPHSWKNPTAHTAKLFGAYCV